MRKFSKKTVALVVSIALLLCVGIGTTLAYLVDVTGPVTNTFEPSQVSTWVYEEIQGNVKKNVKIQNTGDIDANIRAAIVVTWQDANGNVYGQLPAEGTDYVIDYGNGWDKIDGFYYWNGVVEADDNDPSTTKDMTGVLIESVKMASGATAPEGYALCIEIIASGIQAVGIPVGSHPWFD